MTEYEIRRIWGLYRLVCGECFWYNVFCHRLPITFLTVRERRWN